MSTPTEQPTVLWEPTPEQRDRAMLTRFARWVAERHDVEVPGRRRVVDEVAPLPAHAPAQLGGDLHDVVDARTRDGEVLLEHI